MDQQNETTIIVDETVKSPDKSSLILENESDTSSLVPISDKVNIDSTGSVIPGDNAGAYYGDYSEEIYRYIQQHDIGGKVDDIETGVSNLVTTSSRILIVILFFVFIFYAFKFIRVKGLDL